MDISSASTTDSIEVAINSILKLQPTKLKLYKRSHYIAVRNWLKHYHPSPHASNLETVKGYLEAFHHLCQLEHWQLAYTLLDAPIDIPTSETLHNQLGTWGYVGERIALYKALLDHLPPHQEAILIDGLGHTYHALGHYTTVLEYCQQYGKLLVEAIEDPFRQIRYWGLLGITNHAMGNYAEAIEYHQKRLELSQKLGNYPEEMNAWGDLGITQHSLGAYPDAQAAHERQLLLSHQLKDRIQEGQALGSLGHVFDAMGQSDKALQHYEQHLTLAQEIDDRLGQCGALLGIGNVHKNQNEWEQAISYYQQSLELAREIKHRRGESVALGNLASAYSYLGDDASAYELGLKCLAIAQETGNRGTEAYALYTLGLLLRKIEEYDNALECLVEALDIYEDIGDLSGQGSIWFSLGLIHATLGNVEQVWQYWLYSLAISVQIGLEKRARTTLDYLYTQLCQVEGESFFDNDFSPEIFRTFFAEPLTIIHQVFGEDVAERVLEALAKI